MELAEIKGLIEDTGKAHKEFEHSIKTQMEELKSGRQDAVLSEKVEKLSKTIADLSFDKDGAERAKSVTDDRLSKIEADLKVPRSGENKDSKATETEAYSNAMNDYLRHGVKSEVMKAWGMKGKLFPSVTIQTAGTGFPLNIPPKSLNRFTKHLRCDKSLQRKVSAPTLWTSWKMLTTWLVHGLRKAGLGLKQIVPRSA